ncbi:MAG: hypothetical protein ACE5K0_11640 [Candidatus Methanofastidiosia archaeon]
MLKESKEKYQEIGMSDKVLECDEWIQKIEEQKIEKEAGIEVFVIIVAFLASILILKFR